MQLLYTVLIFVVLGIVQHLVNRLFVNRIEDVSHRYQWRKIVKYISFFVGLLLLSRVWLGVFQNVGTFLGLLSAGLAIAFKDLLVNIVAWMFILIRKPLKVGDRIELGDVRGDVIDIRLFQFSVMEIGNWVDAEQSTGRIIHVPNGRIFTEEQANYTEGFQFIWNEIPILITFESDWEKTKSILQEIAETYAVTFSENAEKQIKEAAKKFLIFYNKLTPIVYTTVKDSGVMLTIRYLCNVRQRRGTTEKIWEHVLKEFKKHEDIDFAYPTTRFYYNYKEGKTEARADIRKERDELSGKNPKEIEDKEEIEHDEDADNVITEKDIVVDDRHDSDDEKEEEKKEEEEEKQREEEKEDEEKKKDKDGENLYPDKGGEGDIDGRKG